VINVNESERLLEEARGIIRKADLEGRERTPEESGRVEELLQKARRARYTMTESTAGDV